MTEQTNVSQTIEAIADSMPQYDENAKALFADLQILSRILKYSLRECRDMSPEEIAAAIGTDIEVGTVPVEPGLTNLQKAATANQENSVLNEGTIYYDVRCTLHLKRKNRKIKILLNLESQNRTTHAKLGYYLEKRVVFYLARMISAQKSTEFVQSEYDNIKKVVSIWICMDVEEKKDSISEIRLTQNDLYGEAKPLHHLDLMQGIIIRLRGGERTKRSRNKLIAMLEDLLAKEDPEQKKKKLEENYGIVMKQELNGRIGNMCNLSMYFVEMGIERGELRHLVDLVCRKIMKGKTLETIAEELEEKPEKIQGIYQVALKHAPEYDVDEIVDELLLDDSRAAV